MSVCLIVLCTAVHPRRPLTVASAIDERLDVVDLFLALPAAAAGLQDRVSGLPDADRLLPKAAAAAKALLQQQQQILEAQQHAGSGERGMNKSKRSDRCMQCCTPRGLMVPEIKVKECRKHTTGGFLAAAPCVEKVVLLLGHIVRLFSS